MTKLEEHANKLSNSLRVTGVFLLIIPVAIFIVISGTDQAGSGLFLAILLALTLVGIVTIVISEKIWRLIEKYGTSEKRMFYFYDSDYKGYR